MFAVRTVRFRVQQLSEAVVSHGWWTRGQQDNTTQKKYTRHFYGSTNIWFPL